MSSYEEIKAEEEKLNECLRKLNEQRAEHGQVIHTIEHIHRSHRTAEQKKLFRESTQQCKELDAQMKPMRARYREIQEIYPQLRQEHRTRLQLEHKHSLNARKDVNEALTTLLDVPSLTESYVDPDAVASILDRFEEIITSGITASYVSQIANLQAEVRELKQQISVIQGAARNRVAEAEERFDRLRELMRSFWSQRVLANADEQARRYCFRVLVTQAWANEVEAALGL